MAASSSSSSSCYPASLKIKLSIFELDGTERELVVRDFWYYTSDLLNSDVEIAFGIPLAEVSLVKFGENVPIDGRKHVYELDQFNNCALQLVRVGSNTTVSDESDQWPYNCLSCGERMTRHIWETLPVCKMCFKAQLDQFGR